MVVPVFRRRRSDHHLLGLAHLGFEREVDRHDVFTKNIDNLLLRFVTDVRGDDLVSAVRHVEKNEVAVLVRRGAQQRIGYVDVRQVQRFAARTVNYPPLQRYLRQHLRMSRQRQNETGNNNEEN